MSVGMARTEAEEYEEVIELRVSSSLSAERSARTIRVHPSRAKAVAVAFPMPGSRVRNGAGMRQYGCELLTGRGTGDESDAGEEGGGHG